MTLWIFVLAAAIVGVACVGATIKETSIWKAAGSRIERHRPVAASVELQGATRPHAANVSARDLRLPRAPRHRSERPTSSLTEVEALAATTVVAIIEDDGPHATVIEFVPVAPLAGHPLSLLRPPSLLAG